MVEKALSELQKKDLQSLPWGYFSETDLEKIFGIASSKLQDRCASGESQEQAWTEVLREFHSSKYWGTPVFVHKPKPLIETPQTPARKIAKYVFLIFNSFIIMKTFILYFALVGVSEDRDDYKVFMWLAIALSFGNLLYFGYRNRNDEDLQ